MDLSTYPIALRDLLTDRPLQPLGPGQPRAEKQGLLKALTIPAAFAPHSVRNEDMARACLSGLFLLHDFLDESHAISQDLHTVEGSYWHGIMHRREPDYWNSKYWFRRVGTHAVFADLAREVPRLLKDKEVPRDAAFLTHQTGWDPFAFVDLCEKAAGGGELEMVCRAVQDLEWQLLFDYCLRNAV